MFIAIWLFKIDNNWNKIFLKFWKKYFIHGKLSVHKNEKVEQLVTFYFIECHKIIKEYKSIYICQNFWKLFNLKKLKII